MLRRPEDALSGGFPDGEDAAADGHRPMDTALLNNYIKNIEKTIVFGVFFILFLRFPAILVISVLRIGRSTGDGTDIGGRGIRLQRFPPGSFPSPQEASR